MTLDSALVVGPLAHSFGWDYSWIQKDLDRLTGASLADHIIERRDRITGENLTNWKLPGARFIVESDLHTQRGQSFCHYQAEEDWWRRHLQQFVREDVVRGLGP